jgi:Protein of unknown function (DUF2628)
VNAPTEDELRAVFGPRADYYLEQWRGTARRTINRPALFLAGLWLPFRRMYRITFLFFLAVLIETLLEELIFRRLGFAHVPRGVELASALAPGVVCGAFGNRWYISHVTKLVARAYALGLGEEERLKELARQGGTRPLHAAAFFLLLVGLAWAGVQALEALGGA